MYFHFMKSIFTVSHCMQANNLTSDSTAVTTEVAEGDSWFVYIRTALVPGIFFQSVIAVDVVKNIVCPHKPCLF